MLVRDKNRHQSSFFMELRDRLDQSHPIYQLANKINWDLFEREFAPLYCLQTGRPAKPIRLMVGLLILKHLRNISDESVVEQWGENAYYQYFCGAISFTPSYPCDASELVHFRHRIGQNGVELILAESIRVNDDDRTGKGDKTAFIDSTVQEKNITYPTDAKLHKKIVKQCQKIAQDEHTEVRQSYTRTLKELSRDQRFRNHPKNRKKAIRADKRVKSIAGRLVRELERNLPEDSVHRKRLALFTEVLSQTKSSKQRIYSLHEHDVKCISKGKEHKLFCKRAGIEPRIGHLKADHRLGRNFYKGLAGDAINVMLAAAAFNFKRAMRTLLAIIEKWILGVIKIVAADKNFPQQLFLRF